LSRNLVHGVDVNFAQLLNVHGSSILLLITRSEVEIYLVGFMIIARIVDRYEGVLFKLE
jgi:hypothetical protein